MPLTLLLPITTLRKVSQGPEIVAAASSMHARSSPPKKATTNGEFFSLQW